MGAALLFCVGPPLSCHGTRLSFSRWNWWKRAAGRSISVAGGNGSACFQPEWARMVRSICLDAEGSGQHAWREGSRLKKAVDLDADSSMPQWSFTPPVSPASGRQSLLHLRQDGEAGAAIAALDEANLAPRETGFSAACDFGQRRRRCPGGAEGRRGALHRPRHPSERVSFSGRPAPKHRRCHRRRLCFPPQPP